MESESRFDAEGLSRLIFERLAQTHREDQAAAFERLGIWHLLLDMVAIIAKPQQDVPVSELTHQLWQSRRLRSRWSVHHATEPHAEDATAFLTHLDGDHLALVCDFDSLVDRIGRVSALVQSAITSESYSKAEMERRFCSLWIDEDHRIFHRPHRIPLKDSLARLRPVGELGPDYQNPDFANTTRLRATDFLK